LIDLCCRTTWINANDNCAKLQHGELADLPVLRCARHYGDALALGETQIGQSRRNLLDGYKKF